MKFKVTLLVILILIPTVVRTQTISNPQGFEFTVAADHEKVVTHYELTVFSMIGGVRTQIFNITIGKPTPNAARLITLPFANFPEFSSLPKSITYIAMVSAFGIGPLGAQSEFSNAFTFTTTPLPIVPTLLKVK